jgi:hypothetical protein
MYDLIGDIHGHADELIRLLEGMGYKNSHGVYRHPERRAVFVGDFIDRGPQIREVLQIVRPMVEQGNSFAVMGNHELNALAYHTEYPRNSDRFLRPHDTQNKHQHQQTLDQLTPPELADYLGWFRTLPLWLELGGLRVVHACWDEEALRQVGQGLAQHSGVTDRFLQSACLEGGELFKPVEILLKGKEADLPSGKFFLDNDGIARTRIRTRWYIPAEGQTFGTYAFYSPPIESNVPLPECVVQGTAPYPKSAEPVFFGHYWLSAPRPSKLACNVACIDYSVAKRGFLCAYRWRGEKDLKDNHFEWVKAEDVDKE